MREKEDQAIIEKLSEIAVVNVFSKKTSFVLLMTGKGLEKFTTVNKVMDTIKPIMEDYPGMQVMVSEDTFLQVVLNKAP